MSKEACKYGHSLSGANVILRDAGNGKIARTCKICLLERSRRYYAARKAGIPSQPRPRTLEEKIEAHSKVIGECRIWEGPKDKKGYPVLHHDGKEQRLRKYLYERKHPPLKNDEIITMSCGNRACIEELHFNPPLSSAALARTKWTRQACDVAFEKRQQQIRAFERRREFGNRIMAVYPRVMSFACSRSSGTSCDVEAIVMDVVTNTYRQLDQGREINDLQAFMCTGVRHALIDHLRRRDTVMFEVIGERYDNTPDSEETTNPLVMSEMAETQVELRNWYLAALKRIKTRTRRGYDVMRLKLQGLSLEEIASKLGLKPNTIEGYMRKARAIVIPEDQRRKALIK